MQKLFSLVVVLCYVWVASGMPADGARSAKLPVERSATALAPKPLGEIMKASATGRQIGFGFGVGGWPYGPNFGISLGGGYPGGYGSYGGYGDYYGGHYPEHYHHHHDHGHHDHGHHDYGHHHYRG